MDTPSSRPSPGNLEDQFRHLLDPFREAALASNSLDGIHDALAELRRVELEVDNIRISLLLGETASHEPDEILDSRQTARELGRSLDWVYRNRPRLAPALVSPPDSRQRYSRTELKQLRDTWSKTDWRKK